jgi:hypothetical protein
VFYNLSVVEENVNAHPDEHQGITFFSKKLEETNNKAYFH